MNRGKISSYKMDSSMDTLTGFDSYLPEILLETVLTVINIESFFSAIMSDNSCCKKYLFFRLKQNKLTFGLLPQFTQKMKQMLFDCGSCLANTEATSLIKTYDASKLTPVFPRMSRTTTLVDLEIIVFPNDRNQYNQPEYPDKYPTQVTEIDAGQPSFESYPRHTASRNIGSGSSGVGQTTNAPSISNERQTAINSNLVTSGNRIPIHRKPPRYPDYMEQPKRQASFSTPRWSVDNKPDPFLLAECGFFFTGNQDLVRCYQCGIGLKDWVREDDVLTEHVKHSSSCDFIVIKFGKNKIDRMKLALTNDDNNEIVSNASQQLPYKIRSPRYQTMEARMASFKDFPKQNNVSAQQLAVAGLFYTGKGDLCRCFTCDGGLKDWSSGDDPVKEHATYFPNCSYIIKLKGSEYIKQQTRQSNESMGASGGSSAVTQPTQASPNLPMDRLTVTDNEYSSFTVSQVVQKLGYSEVEVNTAKAQLELKGTKFPTAEEIVNTLLDMLERSEHFRTSTVPQAAPEDKNDLQALTEENKELSRLIYCMLCITGEADILFLPCTHHRTCHECAVDLIFCPVCDEFIKEKVKTFRS
ncbi:baculoviral IAP repeat-containing protein 7-like isoform X2 [Mercenaria mercenaria]|uniref:baculoviral IAP repeat-containing protein 7-like isoform X2 n=1 Tax=Mercenaria mercenaria TaxID=6596 RepID=UPI00234E83D1|nr:baculoviral IAP repeat-containing protein 7-like isoform X2 [Mercenaria mercenaria]